MISGLQLHDNGETVGCRQATGNVAFREAEEFALAFEGDSISPLNIVVRPKLGLSLFG